MDPFSHGILGGTVASLFSRDRPRVRVAVLCGVSAAMAPDLDVVIRSASDSLLAIQYHRHFTHALAFVPVGAGFVAALWWFIFRRKIPFVHLWLYCAAGMATHGLLDSLTNYGTHYFWPFTAARESWNIISIVDPVFSLTLLALLGAATIRRRRAYAAVGVVFALLYWSAGYVQRERATDAMMATAASRGHAVERSEVKPAFATILVWRTHYMFNGRFYIDAYHVAPGGGTVLYKGGDVAVFVPPALPVGSRLDGDIKRFSFFSDGWLAPLADNAAIIGDARFGLLPTDTNPLWGIEIDVNNPNAAAQFVSLRQRRANDVAMLWNMVKGGPIAP